MQKRKMFFRMITASLIRRRSRMLVALLAIAIGAAILSGLVTIYYDVPRQMSTQFRNYGANMIVMPEEDTFRQEDLQAVAAVIAADELVGATPYRYESVRIHEQPVMAAGTDFAAARKTSPYWSVEGEWPEGEGSFLVGSSIASALELTPGTEVELGYNPNTEKTDGKQAETAQEDDMNFLTLTVSGIVSTGGSEEEYIYLDIHDLETLTGQAGFYDLAELSVSAGKSELDAYLERIPEAVPALRASLVKRVTASETTVLGKLQALVLLVTIVVLALTMICVATTMTAVVTERRREIGLRKAIGASDSSIVGEFMGEGFLLGAAGGLIGAFVGFAFAQTVSVHVFSSSIRFRPLLVPIAILVSVAITGIASAIPVRSATKVDPALVLKGE